MFDLSKLVICWVSSVVLAIWRPLRNLWSHVDSKCGQVSLSLLCIECNWDWGIYGDRRGFSFGFPIIALT